MTKISGVIVTLALLSACGERGASPETGEKPSAVAGQAQGGDDAAEQHADATAQEALQAPANAAPSEALATRAAAYKRALLPLVAANYTGDCNTDAGLKSRAAISVGADGTVSAPGMKASQIMDVDAMLVLTKVPSRGTKQTIALLAGSDVSTWTVNTRNTRDEVASFRSAHESIRCVNDSPVVQSRAGNMYPALATFFIAASRSMQCTDATTVPKLLKITPGATQVSVGGDAFSLVRANAGEIASVIAGGKGLTYEMDGIDGENVQLQLDQNGAMRFFSALNAGRGKSYVCTAKQQ